jgi:cytochrome P450
MTNQQVRDEAITLFLAGHDTTANTLTWAWYLLSQHPGAAEKLHQELATVLGGRAPTYDDLPRLRYTEMVIQEALRLYPPAWIISRQAVEDITIYGYPVKKDQLVFISPYSLHHNPRWFPEPERYA